MSDNKPIIGVLSGFLLIGIIFYANSGMSSIGNTGPHPRNVILDSINKPGENSLIIGNGTPSRGELQGTTYISGPFETGKGIFTTPEQYGSGLTIRSNNDTILLLDVSGNATFNAELNYICNFVDNYYNQSLKGEFLTVISANTSNPNVDYNGATGYITDIVNESCLQINTGAGGEITLLNATDFKYVIYTHPLVAFLDSGTYHIKIGNSDESVFHFFNPEGKSQRSVLFDDTSASNNHDVIQVNYNSNNFFPGSILGINYLAGDMEDGQSADIIDIVVDPQNATGGELHALSFFLSEPDGIDFSAIATGNHINVIHQHLGSEESNITAFKSELTVVTNITDEVQNATLTPVFVFDDDYLYVGGNGWFGEINVNLGVFANQPILPIYSYSSGPATWTLFGAADGTNGFTANGQISWDPSTLTSWSDESFQGQDKYWIRIQRTRNFLVVTPSIETLSITLNTSITDYFWDELGNINVNSLTLNNLTTGSNSGTSLCVDTNGQLCVCDLCA